MEEIVYLVIEVDIASGESWPVGVFVTRELACDFTSACGDGPVIAYEIHPLVLRR